MKIYIILTLIAITSGAEWRLRTLEEWEPIYKTCVQSYPVSEEFIERAKVEKYIPKEVFEVIFCVLRSVEVWSDSDGFIIDRMMIALKNIAVREQINRKFVRDSFESCTDRNTEGSTPLEWAYRCFKCFRDNEDFFKVLREAKFYEEPELL